MKIKIENKPIKVTFNVEARGAEWNSVLVALRDLEIGQSFLVPKVQSSVRLLLSALPVLMGRKYKTRKEANGQRIGRVS